MKTALAILKDQMGGAFAKLETKAAPVEMNCPTDEHHEQAVGKVSTLKITALKGANGKVPVIENAPSPIAPPKTSCAKADVNLYDDGTAKWG